MKRTNIHLREDQRAGLAKLARRRKTAPAIEVREAVDTHLLAHNGAKARRAK